MRGYPSAVAVAETRKQPADGADPRLDDRSHDALLVVSFGGPEGPDDVMPFLENVTRGRNVPRERLLEVAHHYERFGGVSPINRQNRELIAALDLRAAEVEELTACLAERTRERDELADRVARLEAELQALFGTREALAEIQRLVTTSA